MERSIFDGMHVLLLLYHNSQSGYFTYAVEFIELSFPRFPLHTNRAQHARRSEQFNKQITPLSKETHRKEVCAIGQSYDRAEKRTTRDLLINKIKS
jgi:hypothetical protein